MQKISYDEVSGLVLGVEPIIEGLVLDASSPPSHPSITYPGTKTAVEIISGFRVINLQLSPILDINSPPVNLVDVPISETFENSTITCSGNSYKLSNPYLDVKIGFYVITRGLIIHGLFLSSEFQEFDHPGVIVKPNIRNLSIYEAL